MTMDSTGRPVLVTEGGADEGQLIALGGTTTFGREPGNDVVVIEAGVSRQHASIVQTGDGYLLTDLGSSNGTFVNQQRLTEEPHLLQDGDRIRLGTVEWYFLYQLAAEVVAAPTETEPQQAQPTAAPPTIIQTAPVQPTMIQPTADAPTSEAADPPGGDAPAEREERQPAEGPVLVAEGDPQDQRVIPLGATTTVGREPDNEVVVSQPGVSRNHARIVQAEGGYLLSDLGSSNGTFVNDQRVMDEAYLLQDGDRIRLGSIELSFVFRLAPEGTGWPVEVTPEPSQATPAQPTIVEAAVSEPTMVQPLPEQATPEEPPRREADMVEKEGVDLAAERPVLRIEGGPDEDEIITLGPTTSLGREDENDVAVPDPGISRQHAQIVETDEGMWIRDLGSTNGTYVNQGNIATEGYLLKDGDRIRLGASQISFAFWHSEATALQPTAVEPVSTTPAVAEPAAVQPVPVAPTLTDEELEDNWALQVASVQAAPGAVALTVPTAEPGIEFAAAPVDSSLRGRIRALKPRIRTLTLKMAVMLKIRQPEEEVAPPEGEEVTEGEAIPADHAVAVAEPPAEPPEEAEEKAPVTGFAALERRLRATWLKLRRQPESSAEEDAVIPVPEYAESEALPAMQKLTGTVRNLQEDFTLRMRQRTLTLSDENGVIRAAMFEGNEVLAWGLANPQDGDPFDDESNFQPAGVNGDALVHSVLKELRGRRARIVSNLPLHIPLLRHLPMPKIKRRYLEQVVTSEVGESIPFSADEVDIKWHLREKDDLRELTAIAVQKEVVDAHVNQIKGYGMGPMATYTQAAALGLAAGVPDALVVHLVPGQAAVVLVRDSQPRAVYQVAAMDADQGIQAQAEAIARSVEQVEGFDQTLALGDIPELPIVITGQVPRDGQLLGELRQQLQREVVPPSPTVEFPEGFPVTEYATNIGLALLDQGRPKPMRKATEDSPVAINLLSARHLPRPIPVVPIAVFLALGFFGLLAFNFGSTADAKIEDSESSSKVVVDLRQKVSDANAARNALKAREGDVQALHDLTLELKSRVSSLATDIEDLGDWFNLFHTITETTRPEEVTVVNLTPSGDSFVLIASAARLPAALQYAERIRESGLFVDVIIRNAAAKGAPLSAGVIPDLRSVSELLPSLGIEGGSSAVIVIQDGVPQALSFVIEATVRSSTDELSKPGEQ